MAKVTPIPKPERSRHFVKEWRKFRGLSQEALAERISKTHGAISQLERGLVDYTQGMLEALAYALRCEPGDLLTRDPFVDNAVADLTALLRKVSLAEQQRAVRILRELLSEDQPHKPEIVRQEDDDFAVSTGGQNLVGKRTVRGGATEK